MLECEDGSRHFVKAASTKAQRMFADAYREEARKLAALPDRGAGPAPALDPRRRRLVRALDRVRRGPAAAPALAAAELQLCLDMLTAAAPVLTPPPAELALPHASEEFAEWPAYWDHLRTSRPDLPHLEEAAALAGRYVEVMAGQTLVHTDVRDDNLLLTADGRALLCDWNWPMVGAAWLDSLFLLIGPRGDGLDVGAVIAGHPLLSAVPDERDRRRAGAGDRLLPEERRRPGPADLAVPPRRPALAGRGLLGRGCASGAAGFSVLARTRIRVCQRRTASRPRHLRTFWWVGRQA